MTKEFIEQYIEMLKSMRHIMDLDSSPKILKDHYDSLIDYLSQHPVMQEGKEKVYSPPHGLASRLPVDDEQPEHRGMPLFPTPYSDTDIHPRSEPPNDPGAHSMNIL